MSNLPNPAPSYPAKRAGKVVVNQAESGAVMLYFPCSVILPEGGQFGYTHSVCIFTKNGELQMNNVKSLRRIWPDWDGVDLFWLEDLALPEADAPAEFELGDCYHDDSYTPEGADAPLIRFRAKWLNPVGGGGGGVPEPLDAAGRKAFNTQWQSKLKAASASMGGAKSKTATAAASTPAPAPAKKPAPAKAPAPAKKSNATAGMARTLTGDEAWGLFIASHPEHKTEQAQNDELGPIWFAAIAEMFPEKAPDGSDLALKDFGALATHLGV